MMKLDEKALEAARAALYTRFSLPNSYLDTVAEKCITAYLAAAPAPAPDVARMAANLIKIADASRRDDGSDIPLGEQVRAAADALTAQAESISELEREARNLQAALTARAKAMLKAREALVNMRDDLEDEGDRIYFGSTNDADAFKDFVQELDAWAWNDIMNDSKLPDVYEKSREAHSRAEAAERQRDEARAKLERARPVIEAAEKQLLAMSICGCTCATKSPDLQWHDVAYRYRQAQECLENVEAAKAALAAIDAPGESDGWLPIESAPKDGTRIDLWAEGKRWTDARWGKHDPDSDCPWGPEHWIWVHGEDRNSFRYPEPTHWRPLPAPPAQGRE